MDRILKKFPIQKFLKTKNLPIPVNFDNKNSIIAERLVEESQRDDERMANSLQSDHSNYRRFPHDVIHSQHSHTRGPEKSRQLRPFTRPTIAHQLNAKSLKRVPHEIVTETIARFDINSRVTRTRHPIFSISSSRFASSLVTGLSIDD